MLHPPYTRYNHIYVYYLDQKNLPTLEDPDLIGIWIEDDTAIYFFHKPKEQLIASLCKVTGAKIVYQANLDYKDWEAGVEITSFATSALHIRPIWEPKPSGVKNIPQIILDPSVIFGSGFHATTRLCLETLEKLMQGNSKVKTVLDLGTGTGLLAIAAANLGAERVLAIDNNPLACKVCKRNLELNNCTDKVTVQQVDLLTNLPDSSQFDLIIANLYKGLLVTIFSNNTFWEANYYMISGFIPSMKPELLAALPAKKLKMLSEGKSAQWRLWLMENTGLSLN